MVRNLMIFHLYEWMYTIVFVEVYYWNIVSILSDFGNLVFKVEVSQLSNIADLVIVYCFAWDQYQQHYY